MSMECDGIGSGALRLLVRRLGAELVSLHARGAAGGTHGFLRHTALRAPRVEPAGLVYSIEPNDIPSGAHPLEASFTIIPRIIP